MSIVLLRFAIVWTILHTTLFFIERYRYKNSDMAWYAFKDYGMLDITYFILILDKLGGAFTIIGLLGYWILQPII